MVGRKESFFPNFCLLVIMLFLVRQISSASWCLGTLWFRCTEKSASLYVFSGLLETTCHCFCYAYCSHFVPSSFIKERKEHSKINHIKSHSCGATRHLPTLHQHSSSVWGGNRTPHTRTAFHVCLIL